MFTGIVQATAGIAAIEDRAGLRTFTLEFPAGFCKDLEIGASVATDGVCLTVTELVSPTRANFDVMLQSLNITTLGSYGVGDHVNVERAAKDGAEIGGHPLSGHIDFSATLADVKHLENNVVWRVAVPADFRRYVFANKKAGDQLNIEIERSTQVVVDTVRETVQESLGRLQPVLEALLKEKGLTLEDFVQAPNLPR